MQKKFMNILKYRNDFNNMTYENSLKIIKILSLENRRKVSDMMILFKILNNYIDCSYLLSRISFISQARLPARPSRKINIFVPPFFRKNYTRNCYISRSLDSYNKQFSDIDIFGSSLSVFRKELINRFL